jgi:hypothetical protein
MTGERGSESLLAVTHYVNQKSQKCHPERKGCVEIIVFVISTAFLSFRPKGEILISKDMNSLRFLTYVRNDRYRHSE